MNEKCLLSRDMWERFVRNEMSPGEREEITAHLVGDCVECERFFIELGRDASEQGLCWAAENMISDRLREQGPIVEDKDEIFRNIIASVEAPPSNRPRRSHILPVLAPAVIVIILALMVLLKNYNDPGDYNGIKGEIIEPPSIFLQVAVLKSDAGSAPERGIPGEKYRSSDTLIFRYELGASGYVYLLRSDGQNIEIIDPPTGDAPLKQQKGVYEFRENGKTLGYSLKGLSGRQAIIVVASAESLGLNPQLKQLVNGYLQGKYPGKSSEWAIDSFEIQVVE